MDFSRDIRADGLHHAYVITGSGAVAAMLIEHLERELGMPFRGNPDVEVREHETLSIDECRELVRRAQVKPLGGRKVFILTAYALTREAQNSLLKLFEEPPPTTHFFLCVPAASQLLPTLRSRVWLIEAAEEAGDDDSAQQFLRASVVERIALVDTIAKERATDRAAALLNDLEATLYAQEKTSATRTALEHITAVRQHIQSSGAPLKTLLESVALVCP